jgi:hypothetical protein
MAASEDVYSVTTKNPSDETWCCPKQGNKEERSKGMSAVEKP